jgi:putative hydrolase of the HAD superfamily
MTPDLSHVEVWLFDLDNTLYPPACELMAMVDERMNLFIQREAGLEPEGARALRKQYYHEHGTTLAGLIAHHGVDPAAFIAEVQQVSMDCVAPDPELRGALARLPGRRLVFTNAGGDYAEKVLARIGVADLFEDIFHIEAADYIPKPQRSTFERMVARHGVAAPVACFFEDSERNLAPAAELGMTTVLVGDHAAASTASFVHHRTAALAPFLAAAKLKETAG